MGKALSKFWSAVNRPLPGWLTVLLTCTVVASASVPMYVGSVSVPSSGSFSNSASTTALANTGSNTLTSNTTGALDAFIFNTVNAVQPTGYLVNFKANGSSEATIGLTGNAIFGGTVTGTSHIANAPNGTVPVIANEAGTSADILDLQVNGSNVMRFAPQGSFVTNTTAGTVPAVLNATGGGADLLDLQVASSNVFSFSALGGMTTSTASGTVPAKLNELGSLADILDLQVNGSNVFQFLAAGAFKSTTTSGTVAAILNETGTGADIMDLQQSGTNVFQFLPQGAFKTSTTAGSVPATFNAGTGTSADLSDWQVNSSNKAAVNSSGDIISYSSTTGATHGLYASGSDVTAARTASTGVVFLGSNGTHFLQYDGTEYVLPSSALQVNGGVSDVCYSLGGSACANTAHCARGSLTAAGATLAVTFGSSAQFASGTSYGVFVTDLTSGAEMTSFASFATTGFTVNSTTSGHIYYVNACGT